LFTPLCLCHQAVLLPA